MGKDSYFTGQTVYSQVLKLLDKEKFRQISRSTKGSEAYVKRFDGYQHLLGDVIRCTQNILILCAN